MSIDSLPYDTETYRLGRIAQAQAKYGWARSGASDMTPVARDTWQYEFRDEFAQILGNLGDWAVPAPETETLDIQQLDGYRRETVSFTTRHNLRAFGYFLIPDGITSPRPSVLCVPGHGRGIDSLVGIAEDGTQCQLNQRTPNDYPLECVARGFPTLVLELTSFGVRRDGTARASGPGTSSCGRDAMAALMLGETIAGWRVWDSMRGLDYLQSRTDCVDRNKLGMIGISGGGLVALFTAAMDTRLTGTIVSCYFNTFAGSVLTMPHCVDNYVPGLLNLCEMPDLAALIAPRVLCTEAGRTDPLFPIAAFDLAAAQAREIYTAFGVQDSYLAPVGDGGHSFNGTEAFPFLERGFIA